VYPCCEYASLWSVEPHYSPLPHPFPPAHHYLVHSVMSSTCPHVMHFDIADLFLFLSLLQVP
jgi:hypothetical protein